MDMHVEVIPAKAPAAAAAGASADVLLQDRIDECQPGAASAHQ